MVSATAQVRPALRGGHGLDPGLALLQGLLLLGRKRVQPLLPAGLDFGLPSIDEWRATLRGEAEIFRRRGDFRSTGRTASVCGLGYGVAWSCFGIGPGKVTQIHSTQNPRDKHLTNGRGLYSAMMK